MNRRIALILTLAVGVLIVLTAVFVLAFYACVVLTGLWSIAPLWIILSGALVLAAYFMAKSVQIPLSRKETAGLAAAGPLGWIWFSVVGILIVGLGLD